MHEYKYWMCFWQGISINLEYCWWKNKCCLLWNEIKMFWESYANICSRSSTCFSFQAFVLYHLSSGNKDSFFNEYTTANKTSMRIINRFNSFMGITKRKLLLTFSRSLFWSRFEGSQRPWKENLHSWAYTRELNLKKDEV